MKFRTALPMAIACALLAVTSGCRSFQANARAKFQSSVTHLAVFDVTVTQEHPPADSTGVNIEVRSGPTNPPSHLIGSATNQSLSPWSGTFSDPAYQGEATYYVEVAVVYLPSLLKEVQVLKFSQISPGVWIVGVLM